MGLEWDKSRTVEWDSRVGRSSGTSVMIRVGLLEWDDYRHRCCHPESRGSLPPGQIYAAGPSSVPPIKVIRVIMMITVIRVIRVY